jgi:hypothetical protein
MKSFCGGGTETPCSSTTGNVFISRVALSEDVCSGGLGDDGDDIRQLLAQKFVVKLVFI